MTIGIVGTDKHVQYTVRDYDGIVMQTAIGSKAAKEAITHFEKTRKRTWIVRETHETVWDTLKAYSGSGGEGGR